MNAKSTSEQNKEDLNRWYSTSDYEDIKFWVPPSVIKSQEESEAEVLTAIRAFEADDHKKPATGESV